VRVRFCVATVEGMSLAYLAFSHKVRNMKTSNLALTFAITVFCLAGCREAKIDDGLIPPEYLSQAQRVVGTYQGSLSIDSDPGAWGYFPSNTRTAKLTISIYGRRPQFLFSRDYASDNCRTSIGRLQSVRISDRGQLESATFEFDTDRECNIPTWGRVIIVSFSERNGKPHLMFSARGGQMAYTTEAGNEFTEIHLNGNFQHD
jgi:hypothetical protein